MLGVLIAQDLLNPKAGDLQLRENAEDGVHVPGMKEVLVTRLEDCLELLKVGERNRCTDACGAQFHQHISYKTTS